MAELKPCPFCGSNEVFVVNPKNGGDFPIGLNSVALLGVKEVLCPNCGTGVRFGFAQKSANSLTKEEADQLAREAAESWNRRADKGGAGDD